jgi:hypothetical protein
MAVKIVHIHDTLSRPHSLIPDLVKGNQFYGGSSDSNILKIFRMLDRSDGQTKAAGIENGQLSSGTREVPYLWSYSGVIGHLACTAT